MPNSDVSWENFGKLDPYYGVVTNEQFHKENLNETVLKEFFESGETHIRFVLDTIHQHLDENFEPNKALDFGCGVGRLTIPLARICTHITGVDISESMLREAEVNCEKRDIKNVNFIKSDDQLARVTETFNFVHSYIVLQHIPTAKGEGILRALIERLVDGGVGCIHFTYFGGEASKIQRLVAWSHEHIPFYTNIVNLLTGRALSYPRLQMNNYNLSKIFAILQLNGCCHSYVCTTNHGGYLGIIIFFQKKVLLDL